MKAVIFTVLFAIMSMISGIAEGAGGMSATQLNGAITHLTNPIVVDNTTGFLTASYLMIGNEKISYTGKTAISFTGCTRGYSATTATSHPDNAKVYSPDAGMINAMLGFDVATTGTGIGEVGFMTFAKNFIFTSVPRLLSWDFNYLKIGSMVYLRIFLWMLSAAFVISLLPYILQALSGLINVFKNI